MKNKANWYGLEKLEKQRENISNVDDFYYQNFTKLIWFVYCYVLIYVMYPSINPI